MRKLLTAIALAASLATPLGTAHAALLTFDDVPGGSVPGATGPMPAAYMGYTFACTGNANCDSIYNYLSWIDSVSWGQGAQSGNFTLNNPNGGTGVIRAEDGSDFTFDGLWAGAAHGTGPRNGTLRGFNNGVEVWTQTLELPNTFVGGFVNFGAMAGAIDELRLDFGDWFFVDDVALNERTSNVPEPASLLLAGLGLAALGGARRAARKSRRA